MGERKCPERLANRLFLLPRLAVHCLFNEKNSLALSLSEFQPRWYKRMMVRGGTLMKESIPSTQVDDPMVPVPIPKQVPAKNRLLTPFSPTYDFLLRFFCCAICLSAHRRTVSANATASRYSLSFTGSLSPG